MCGSIYGLTLHVDCLNDRILLSFVEYSTSSQDQPFALPETAYSQPERPGVLQAELIPLLDMQRQPDVRLSGQRPKGLDEVRWLPSRM